MSAFGVDPSLIDPRLDSRSISTENRTGARGAAGSAGGGRKDSGGWEWVRAAQEIELADIAGPGRIRHIWATSTLLPPERARAIVLEVRYDDADFDSISVPFHDFFGCPHGRAASFVSALVAVQEGRGFNSYVPLPFAERIRIRLRNGSDTDIRLWFQVDYTLEPGTSPASFLHVSFRRENPTTLKQDFVIAEGFTGPGRYLGAVVGVRPTDPSGGWYGEGEVKIYRDGDDVFPTVAGTGLEDYVGSAWGLGRHAALYGGAPLLVCPPNGSPDFVGFFRWHLLDPVMFSSRLRVTIQQIGAIAFTPGQEAELEEFRRTRVLSGMGFYPVEMFPSSLAVAHFERVDDYSAAAFVYCSTPQAVPPVDLGVAVADLALLAYESESSDEAVG
jgi:hypothetical protein